MVTDSFGTKSSKPVEINITLINDQSLNISLPQDTVIFVEDSDQLQLFFTAPVINDPDDNSDQRSVIYSASLVLSGHNREFEWLSFNTSSMYSNDIMGSFDDNLLQLIGNATVDDYERVCIYRCYSIFKIIKTIGHI